mgnify:CR=1 FL=1
MNNEEVIALMAFLACSMIRVKFFEAKYTFYILFSVFLFLLLRTVILLSYDRWMERKIMKTQVEKIFEDSFEDINIFSKIHSEKDVTKEDFPKDDERHKENHSLIEKSSIVFSSLLAISLFCLYFSDRKFYKDLHKIMLGIFIIIAAEMYFTFSVSFNLENNNIKGLRQKVLDKLINS